MNQDNGFRTCSVSDQFVFADSVKVTHLSAPRQVLLYDDAALQSVNHAS